MRSRNPARPDEVVMAAEMRPAQSVLAAVNEAKTAQRAWWDAGAMERSTGLSRFARALNDESESLIDLIVREVGKPLREARAEMARAVRIADFYAQQALAPVGEMHPPGSAGGLLWHERRPHGVAGLITPWNFPIAIPLWKSLPALAVGNAVVLKPSPEALACAFALQTVADRTLPADLFKIIPGDAETGRALIHVSDVISFTGSVGVGRRVVQTAAGRMLPVQAEMGGQNAAIILPDADVTSTVAMIADAGAAYAGQKCTATRRVVVVGDEARYREIADALAAAVDGLVTGDPQDDNVQIGPLINESSRDSVIAVEGAAHAVGGRILTSRRLRPGRGWYADPVVVEGLPPGHELLTEELFGPVIAMQHAADLSAGIAMAQDVRFGLVTSVHGQDVDQLLMAVRSLQSGMVKVNAPSTGVDYFAPFGGERDSSYGMREQGEAAQAFFSSTRTVTFGSLR